MSLLPDYTEIDRLRAELAVAHASKQNLEDKYAEVKEALEDKERAWCNDVAKENARLVAELSELRAQKPVAGLLRTRSNKIECFYRGSLCPIDGNYFPQEFVDALPLGRTVPLYLHQTPAAQAVPEGYALVPIEPTPEMLAAALRSSDTDAFGVVSAWPSDTYRAMLAAAGKATKGSGQWLCLLCSSGREGYHRTLDDGTPCPNGQQKGAK